MTTLTHVLPNSEWEKYDDTRDFSRLVNTENIRRLKFFKTVTIDKISSQIYNTEA